MEVAKAFVTIRPDFGGFRRDLDAGLRKAVTSASASVRVDVDLRDAGLRRKVSALAKQAGAGQDVEIEVDVDADRAERGIGSLRRSIKGLSSDARNLEVATSGLRLAGLAGGAISAAGALQALGGAAVALTAALAPVAGLAATLPSALLSLAQGAGVLALAFGGVKEAVKALGDAESEAVSSARKAAGEQQRFAEARVRASEQVRDAQERLTDAQKDARRAQLDLNDAYHEASIELGQLHEDLKDVGLDQERAALDLERARQRLIEVNRDATASVLDRKEADLAFREADQRLNRLDQRAEILAEQEERAKRAGVEGAKQVVAAKERLIDANNRVRDGQQQINTALREQKAAAAATGTAGAAAMDKLKESMAALSPAGQRFAKFLYSLKPVLKTLKAAAEAGIFPAMETGINRLRVLLPTVRDAIRSTADAISGLVARGAAMLTSGPWRRDFAKIADHNAALIGIFGDAGLNLADALRNITVAAMPLTTWLARLVERWTANIRGASETARQTGLLAGFFERTRDVTKTLFDILGNVGRVLWEIGRAAAPLGGDLLKSFEKLTDQAREFFTSAKGRTQLSEYFERLRPVLESIGRIFGYIAEYLGRALDRALRISERFAEMGKQHPQLEKVAAAVATMALVGVAASKLGITSVASSIGAIALRAGPIGIIATIVAAIGTAAFLASDDTDDLDDSLKDVHGTALELQRFLERNVKDHPKGIVNEWLAGEDVDVGANINQGLKNVKATLDPIIEDLKTKVGGAKGAWTEFIEGFNSEKTTGSLHGFAQNFGAFTKGIVDFPGDVDKATKKLQELVDEAGTWAHKWLDSFAEGLQDGASEAGQKVRETVIGWFKSLVKEVKGFLGIESPSKVFAGIGREVINGLLQGVKEKWEQVKTWARGIPGSFATAIGGWAGNLAAKAGGAMGSMFDQLKKSWETIKGWASGIPRSFAAAIGGFGSALVGVITRGLGQAAAWINKFTSGIVSVAKALGVTVKIPPVVIGTAAGKPGSAIPAFGQGTTRVTHEGGMAGEGRPYTGRALRRDEHPHVLQEGEGVIRADRMRQLGGKTWLDAINTGRQMGAGGEGAASGNNTGSTLNAILAIARRVAPGARATSTYRPGARTRSGAVSYHAKRQAVDFVAPNLFSLWSALNGSGTNWTELIYSGAPNYISRSGRHPISQLSAGVRSDHWDHVHAALAAAGGLSGLLGRILPDIGALVGKVFNSVTGGMRGVGGIAGQLGMGALNKVKDAALDKLRSLVGLGGSATGATGGLSAAEAWIIQRESGGRTTADNPTSTAFGLGQLLLANRQRYAARLGVSPSTTDYGAQLAMFRMYVADRYGTAEKAQAFWQAHGWYGSGGPLTRTGLFGGHKGEYVLSADVVDRIKAGRSSRGARMDPAAGTTFVFNTSIGAGNQVTREDVELVVRRQLGEVRKLMVSGVRR